jgi:hypothetical protein
MNGNVKIEPEELRFTYKLILDGSSDSDILNAYIHLDNIGELSFPLRTDADFIQDRRQEMAIASEVLKDSIRKIVKPFLLKQREEHYAQLADISATLLRNNLDTVIERQSEAIYGFRSTEIYWPRYIIKDDNGIPVQLSRTKLIDLFRKNVEFACKQYTFPFFYDCYLPHIKAEMPDMEVNGGFWPQVEKQPYEVIKTIEGLAKRQEFKGVCPVCSQMETQLLQFVNSKYDYVAQS